MSTEVFHATTVARAGRGVLIRGGSGSGKSALALQLMALGADLVADDRTRVRTGDAGLIADAPDTLPRAIEARHVGLLSVPALAGPVPLCLMVDMDCEETHRLPPPRHASVLGHRLPLLHRVSAPHFPAAVMLYLAGGRVDGP